MTLRKELAEEGLDAGAETIHGHLSRRHGDVPSVRTIWRVLKARGFVIPQPQKRPRSSFIRFEADLPNERWQSDMTHGRLADDRVVEVVNLIDDHSRLCVASRVFVTVRSPDVVRNLHHRRAARGNPASVFTDNGASSPRHTAAGKSPWRPSSCSSASSRSTHGRITPRPAAKSNASTRP